MGKMNYLEKRQALVHETLDEFANSIICYGTPDVRGEPGVGRWREGDLRWCQRAPGLPRAGARDCRPRGAA